MAQSSIVTISEYDCTFETDSPLQDDSGRGSAATVAARFNNGHADDKGGGGSGGLKTSYPPPVRHVSSEAAAGLTLIYLYKF